MSPAARVGWLDVGQCRLELASREMEGPDSPRVRRITPKAQAVLCCLVEANGQVVSRETLLASVWAGSEPTDDVLTQAITQLRKTFAALDGSQAYIETIARSGYRLLVPAFAEALSGSAMSDDGAVAERSDEDRALAASRRRRRRRIRIALVLLGLVILVVGGVAAWQMLRQSPAAETGGGESVVIPATLQRPYRLLTSTSVAETSPAMSPDGQSVAYVRPLLEGGSQIWLQGVQLNSPIGVLDRTPEGAHDRLPVWSPDGRSIAFARFLPDGRCAVLVADVAGQSAPRSLLRCDRTELLSFDWNSDGSALLFGSSEDAPGDGISQFTLADGRWEPLAYNRSPGDIDHAPRLSPDGQWLVFIRNPQLGQVYKVSADGGEALPVAEGLGEVRGVAWLPDSRHVVISRLIGTEARLFVRDILAPSSAPEWDLGVDQAQLPAIARHRPVLSFVYGRDAGQLMRLGAGDGLTPLHPANGQDLLPAVSPDGKQVLFVSERSGVPAMWLAATDGSGLPRQIPVVLPDAGQPSAWSPDGLRALVPSRDGDGRRQLMELEPFSQSVVVLPVPLQAPLQASYTQDESHLLVIDAAGEQPVLHLFDRTRTPWQSLGSVIGVSQVRWDASRNRVLFTRIDRPGIFSLPADLAGEPAVVTAEWPSRWRYRSWTVDGQGRVLYAAQTADCELALWRQPASASSAAMACLPEASHSLFSGFSSQANTLAVLPISRREGRDIAIMSIPGTAAGQL